ncbi:glutathione S-transferase 1-like [Saccostrea echinata]|uniref:glutathione S-transferase 1-like n=1 Tax=Saccostrea echinata TaxID=191078 RepID=UPI002A822FF4|nr:glutathione S-transferase 1-like [Saccostrea echinata]
MPKYVFTYFDGRGRGEPGRMLFAVAGIPFEDRRIKQEDWPALKPKTPGGSLPVLEIDGQPITQSLVIFRHIARTLGLDGQNLLDKARVEEIVEYLVEVKAAGFKVFFGPKDEESQKKLKEDYMAALEKSCTQIERIMSCNKSSDGWAVGNKISFADIMLYEAFESTVENHPTALDKFPKVKACRQKVKSNKKVQEYLSKRKETPF